MEINGIESGLCVECGNMVYVDKRQFDEDGRIYIHWSCKPENKLEIKDRELRDKLHNTIDVMTYEQLEKIEQLLNFSNEFK